MYVCEAVQILSQCGLALTLWTCKYHKHRGAMMLLESYLLVIDCQDLSGVVHIC